MIKNNIKKLRIVRCDDIETLKDSIELLKGVIENQQQQISNLQLEILKLINPYAKPSTWGNPNINPYESQPYSTEGQPYWGVNTERYGYSNSEDFSNVILGNNTAINPNSWNITTNDPRPTITAEYDNMTTIDPTAWGALKSKKIRK